MSTDRIDVRCSRVPGFSQGLLPSTGSSNWKRHLETEITERLGELDDARIRTQVLYVPRLDPNRDALPDSATLDRLNHALAIIGAAAPGRLACFAYIDFDDGAAGVRTLDAALRRDVPGVVVNTRHREHRLDGPFFRPFLARADECGMPIFVRSAALIGSGPAIGERQQQAVGVQGDLGICLARLIFAGVLESLPRLALYVDQGGGILPGLVARLDHGYHVRKECRALLPRPPSAYLRQLYVDGVVMDSAALRCTIELFGPTQVVFASHAGHPALERSRIEQALTETAKVDGDGASALLDDNARRLLSCGGQRAH